MGGGRADPQGTAVRPRHLLRRSEATTQRRKVRDEDRVIEITRVHADIRRRPGADKGWGQLHLEGINVARCTVEGLIRRERL